MRPALQALLLVAPVLAAAPACQHDAQAETAVPDDPPEETVPVSHALPDAQLAATLPPDGGDDYNRLVHEQSPYLLQHARNPVDWYPWGDEAFDRARAEDRPIFLSIGYATCHWCHVMERESFEDPEVAALLNEHFVAIKVDREERPDIDHVYMTVCQMVTGSGGWPLTVLLTPDREPFYVGTYFPRDSVYGRPGMTDLVPALAAAWRDEREAVLESARKATAALQDLDDGLAGAEPGDDALDAAARALARDYDPLHGGFGGAPKFPTPHQLTFLLRHWKRTGDPEALAMVEGTLQAMRRGGVYDHVGFGFHRYSTDRQWLVPHFEKMLYDQALLAIAYTETYQATGKTEYARTAREIFEYVLRDMTAPQGGFYSAEDADSEGEEGLFYLWTLEEVREVLDDDEAHLYLQTYNFSSQGNFTDEATQRRTGRNIPHLTRPLADIAADRDMTEAELELQLDSARRQLFEAREGRIHPLKDDKILTDWNGLMIAAFALGAQALDEPRYAEAASRAANFALARLRDEDGRLLKRYRAGEAGLPAHLDDHAFLAWGLIELYEATFDARYLVEAVAITDQMIERFWDDEAGGFYLTADDGEDLLVRSREIYDGALPSGNSVAAMVLLRLARTTGDPTLEALSAELFRAFGKPLERGTRGHTQMLSALDFATGTTHEVVLAGNPAARDLVAMAEAVRQPYLPNTVILLRPDADSPPIVEIAPYTATQRSVNGRATAYVCRNQACELPTTDVEQMLEGLR